LEVKHLSERGFTSVSMPLEIGTVFVNGVRLPDQEKEKQPLLRLSTAAARDPFSLV
jgi:hypothetical protein